MTPNLSDTGKYDLYVTYHLVRQAIRDFEKSSLERKGVGLTGAAKRKHEQAVLDQSIVHTLQEAEEEDLLAGFKCNPEPLTPEQEYRIKALPTLQLLVRVQTARAWLEDHLASLPDIKKYLDLARLEEARVRRMIAKADL